jgi:hypothetical protein
MSDLTKEQLEEELGKAYRALRGMYGCVVMGERPSDDVVSYHAPTLGAAVRFVNHGALDGSEYFFGKPVGVLHDTLREYFV